MVRCSDVDELLESPAVAHLRNHLKRNHFNQINCQVKNESTHMSKLVFLALQHSVDSLLIINDCVLVSNLNVLFD